MRAVRVSVSLVLPVLALVAAGCDDDDARVVDCYLPDCSASLSILPLGDSITQGNGEHHSYRYELWKLFVDSGWDVDLVGSMTENHEGTPDFPDYGGEVFDRDHEGHWGWRANAIADEIPGWVQEYEFDAVLLHIGTNDAVADHEPANETREEIREIISILRDANPEVTILLAQLLPTIWDEANEYVDALNEEIEVLALEEGYEESPIVLVDMNSEFSNDWLYDGLHPEQNGELWMACRWVEALNLSECD